MIPLVSAEQMRTLDAETINQVGIPGAVLMENAGRGVVAELWALHHKGALDLYSGQVVVVAGPGNNGGDGMVIARYLHNRGAAVRLLLCAERERVRDDALLHLRAAEACGVAPLAYSGESGAGQVAALLQRLSRRDVIIDALLGTGLNQAVSGPLAHVIEAINRSPAIKVAVDLPSGLDANCGVPAGSGAEPVIVRADYTVTLGCAKLGLCGAPGFTYAGHISVVDIGIPEALCTRHGVRARLLDARCLLRLGQAKSPLAHKGTHGHLLIIAGSCGKSGAALLATRAALRVGVGLCTLAAPSDVPLDGHLVEAMSRPYELSSDGKLVAEQLIAAGVGKQALAIGPGLPSGAAMKQALLELLTHGHAPMVLDADALNQLVGESAALRAAAGASRPLVLTPHPGEAARLLGEDTATVQADRIGSARRLCCMTGAVVVLKGARSIIMAPDGQRGADDATAGSANQEGGSEAAALPAGNEPLSISPTGNGGMGSGGMGDVLTGMIGALLAGGWPAYEAACAAVYWHGLAGDVLLAERAPGSILLGSELIDTLDPVRHRALQAQAAQTPWPLIPL